MAEEGKKGWGNTKLFTELVGVLGWIQCGELDRDIEFEETQMSRGKKMKKLGVDALYRFDCPISGRGRVVLLDGKRYKMDTMSAGLLDEFMNDTIADVNVLRRQWSAVMEQRGVNRTDQIDSAIIAWDCPEGWNPQKAWDWIKKIRVAARMNPPVLGVVAPKDILDRLQTIENLSKQSGGLQFWYGKAKHRPGFSSVLAPELLASEMIPLRVERTGETGVVFFDTNRSHSVGFVLHYLVNSGLFSSPALTVWVVCERHRVDDFEEQLAQAMRELKRPNPTLTTPELSVKRLAKVDFAS